MRILLINCVSDRSEIALYLGLIKTGISIDMFCDPRETRQKELTDAGINCEELEIRNRLDLRAIRAISSKLQKQKYDLIFAPTGRGLTSSLFASRKAPIPIVSYRGTMGHLWIDPISRISHLHKRVDSIIANCDAVKGYLESLGVPTNRVHTIFKGHDVTWYNNQPNSSLLQSVGIPKNAFVVGCAANIRPVKGIDIVLKSLVHLQDIPVYLVVIGEDKLGFAPKLAESLGITDRIRMTGFRTDAISLIGACDMTVMASNSREGVPRVIIESLSQRVPVVCTKIGGMPEVVLDQAHGLVIPPNNERALADAIRMLYANSDMRRDFGERGYQFVKNKLSIDEYVSRTKAIFEQVTSNFRNQACSR